MHENARFLSIFARASSANRDERQPRRGQRAGTQRSGSRPGASGRASIVKERRAQKHTLEPGRYCTNSKQFVLIGQAAKGGNPLTTPSAAPAGRRRDIGSIPFPVAAIPANVLIPFSA